MSVDQTPVAQEGLVETREVSSNILQTEATDIVVIAPHESFFARAISKGSDVVDRLSATIQSHRKGILAGTAALTIPFLAGGEALAATRTAGVPKTQKSASSADTTAATTSKSTVTTVLKANGASTTTIKAADTTAATSKAPTTVKASDTTAGISDTKPTDSEPADPLTGLAALKLVKDENAMELIYDLTGGYSKVDFGDPKSMTQARRNVKSVELAKRAHTDKAFADLLASHARADFKMLTDDAYKTVAGDPAVKLPEMPIATFKASDTIVRSVNGTKAQVDQCIVSTSAPTDDQFTFGDLAEANASANELGLLDYLPASYEIVSLPGRPTQISRITIGEQKTGFACVKKHGVWKRSK